MQPPILFLSFANDSQNPLSYLEKESEIIYQLLTPAANRQQIQIHREPFAAIDKIAHYLTEYHNRISLFHFGGHSDSKQLLFKNELANADGIAYQLAQEKALKLVFLNGCSTYSQVQLLLKLGIPAVIATSASVNDSTATNFAENFYKAVAAGYTIGEAFEKASAILKTKSSNHPKIYRDVLQRKNIDDEISWGLYISPSKTTENILDQRLINPKVESKNINTYTKNNTTILSTPILIFSIIAIMVFAFFAYKITDQFLSANSKSLTDEPIESEPLENKTEEEKKKKIVPATLNKPKNNIETEKKKEPIKKLFLSGYVKTDTDDELPIGGAVVSGGGKNTTTDENGFFHLPIDLLSNTNDITVSYSSENFQNQNKTHYNIPKKGIVIFLKPK